MTIQELKKELIDTELKLKNIIEEFKSLKMKHRGVDADTYRTLAEREQCYVEKIVALKAIMKNKKHKIKVEIPEGQEIDRVVYGGYHSYQQDITIQFKPIKKELPKTWEELLPEIPVSYVVSSDGMMWKFNKGGDCENMIGFPTRKLARADESLRKLIQLRDHYNATEVESNLYSIYKVGNGFASTNNTNRGPIVLNSLKLGVEFVKNFKDLIIEALPLL